MLGFYYWMSGVPHMWKDRSIPIKVGRSPPYRGLTAHSIWVDARDIRAHRDRQRHCHSKEEASVCIVIWSIGRRGEHILIEFFAWSRCWLKSLLFRQVEKCYVFHVFRAYVFLRVFHNLKTFHYDKACSICTIHCEMKKEINKFNHSKKFLMKM